MSHYWHQQGGWRWSVCDAVTIEPEPCTAVFSAFHCSNHSVQHCLISVTQSSRCRPMSVWSIFALVSSGLLDYWWKDAVLSLSCCLYYWLLSSCWSWCCQSVAVTVSGRPGAWHLFTIFCAIIQCHVPVSRILKYLYLDVGTTCS